MFNSGCLSCKKKFIHKDRIRKYCSHPCFSKYTTKKVKTICQNCHKSFYKKPSEDRRGYVRKFCNWKCFNDFNGRTLNGKSLSHDGYWTLTVPGRGQMKEHRWIMELFLNRRLKSSEIIHHKDHNKLNNDIANLQILTRAEHNRIHLKERWGK